MVRKWRQKCGILSRDYCREESRRASQCIGRILCMAPQKSWAIIRHLLAVTIQTLANAKDAPNFVEFPPAPGECVHGARNLVFLSSIRVGGESSGSRRGGRNFWYGRPEIAGTHPPFYRYPRPVPKLG